MLRDCRCYEPFPCSPRCFSRQQIFPSLPWRQRNRRTRSLLRCAQRLIHNRSLGIAATLTHSQPPTIRDAVFVSGDDITRGAHTILERYKKKYSDRAKMGTLTFADLEITALSENAAVVLGRWSLKRASDEPHGRFTLIFRKTPDGWRIVHDHTSSAPEK